MKNTSKCLQHVVVCSSLSAAACSAAAVHIKDIIRGLLFVCLADCRMVNRGMAFSLPPQNMHTKSPTHATHTAIKQLIFLTQFFSFFLIKRKQILTLHKSISDCLVTSILSCCVLETHKATKRALSQKPGRSQ